MLIPAVFAVVALVAGAAALFAAGPWLRAVAYACLVVGLMALWWSSLGHPRPALFGMPKGQVVSYVLDEPRSIDVTVRKKPGAEPLTWSIPWNEMLAQQLEKAAQQAKNSGMPLMMGKSHGGGQGYKHKKSIAPLFYPAQPPQLPEKTRP